MKKFLIAACFILSSLGAFSQSKKLWLIYADDAYKKKDYPSAINYYTKVLDDTTILDLFVLPYEVQMVNLPMKDLKDTSRSKGGKVTKVSKYDYILHQLAHAYQLNKDYENAVVSFRRCMDKLIYTEDEYYYALSLMQLKRYKDAMNEFEAYTISSYKTDSLLKQSQHQMASCFFAQDSINNSHKSIIVKMMDTSVINKGSANFAPMYYGGPGKLIFTSARKGGVVNDPDKQDSKYLCDLWFTELQDGVWSKPHNFGRPVNSGLHEGAGIISVDEIMFLTRWSDNNRDEAFIYMAKMQEGKFFECLKLDKNVNISGYKSIHPFISFDGSRLYFSSNRPGGKGGMDIWYCDIDENGATSEPHNLGASVNTAGDEVSPFFHQVSSTLFFASNGHAGLGGLDIFKSAYNVDDTTFAMPKNMGNPINSSKDDAYLIMERTQTKGYFASDREDCVGGHCYDIYEFDNEPIEFDIEGVVFDALSNFPIQSALVTVKDVHGDIEPFFLITDEKGHYFSPLTANMEYFFKAQKNKYFADAASIVTKGKTETTHFIQDFFLNMIEAGDVVIEGIEYDLDKSTLRPRSMEILDRVIELMKLNGNINIELNAHTDTRGSDAHNMALSQARAQSCVDYMILKGISKDRLNAKGYGETKPIYSDAEIEKLPTKEEKEAEHQKNRRTAFRVVAETDLKGKTHQKS
jgi:OOP family OmpA-OmpF porin